MLHRPVGALVAEHPGWAEVFERIGIDYCCHGAMPLWEACEAAGVTEASVLEALGTAEAGSPPASACPSLLGWTPAAIVDHVVGVHHGYLRHHLAHLEDLLSKVHAVHHERHPELDEVQVAFRALHAELDAHLMHEEQVVFPACVAGADPTDVLVPELVRQVLTEHDLAAGLLARIAGATGRYAAPPDACASYRLLLNGLAELEAEIHRHVHEENNVLFPTVLAVAGGQR